MGARHAFTASLRSGTGAKGETKCPTGATLRTAAVGRARRITTWACANLFQASPHDGHESASTWDCDT
ncbi:uncharacterized protein EI97DRAFT_310967 [Westerdykella ornata]|uniref:Uncharacterized protein n=1 Tax=Westerdykella ornata TaxID=318751 RepID=A0A6A6JKY3_WESOR|nr:uncharacterized protein EI97DRAFT_310967 [Westerdykella ornata]KAF2277142.1 hypothetical protein EI97DRAFT_310967 [Westerdykella ornata]